MTTGRINQVTTFQEKKKNKKLLFFPSSVKNSVSSFFIMLPIVKHVKEGENSPKTNVKQELFP